MRVDALPDFDGGKLISTDLRVLPRADLGQISLCFCWGCGWAPRERFNPLRIPLSARGCDQAAEKPATGFWSDQCCFVQTWQPWWVAPRLNATRRSRNLLEIEGQMGQVWISTPFCCTPTSRLTPQEVKTGSTWSIILGAEVIDVTSYLQHKLCSYRWKSCHCWVTGVGPLGTVWRNLLLNGGHSGHECGVQIWEMKRYPCTGAMGLQIHI